VGIYYPPEANQPEPEFAADENIVQPASTATCADPQKLNSRWAVLLFSLGEARLAGKIL
jgi:hypothetical protein